MEGLILLLLIVVVTILVVPAIALAKSSQALRSIEELKERLRMLETRPGGSREAAPDEAPEIIGEPPPPAPIPPPVSVPPPLPVSVIPPMPKVEPVASAAELRFETAAPPARK